MKVSPHTFCAQHPGAPQWALMSLQLHAVQAMRCGAAAIASAQPRGTLHRALSCQLRKPSRVSSRHWVSCRLLALGAARGCTMLPRGQGLSSSQDTRLLQTAALCRTKP